MLRVELDGVKGLVDNKEDKEDKGDKEREEENVRSV